MLNEKTLGVPSKTTWLRNKQKKSQTDNRNRPTGDSQTAVTKQGLYKVTLISMSEKKNGST